MSYSSFSDTGHGRRRSTLEREITPKLRFPLYKSHPRKLTLVPKHLLNVEEKRDIDLLLQLPRPISCREVFCVLHVEDHTTLFEGKFDFAMTTSFLVVSPTFEKSVPLEVADLMIEEALGEPAKETQVEDTQVVENPLAQPEGSSEVQLVVPIVESTVGECPSPRVLPFGRAQNLSVGHLLELIYKDTSPPSG
ncbi:hypothetical protein V8G54_002281 [Vigna mungo]|uniref:Uncharacterized protein n=1 Tax=Vigna mungo TaxID=3915 RepID=A0AAQ3PB20_VIGMU